MKIRNLLILLMVILCIKTNIYADAVADNIKSSYPYVLDENYINNALAIGKVNQQYTTYDICVPSYIGEFIWCFRVNSLLGNGDVFANNQWVLMDLDNDGLYEYYYVKESSILANDITPDGYYVDQLGRWGENGEIKKENLNQKRSDNVQEIIQNAQSIISDVDDFIKEANEISRDTRDLLREKGYYEKQRKKGYYWYY